MNDARAKVAEEIRQQNAEMIAAGSLSFCCPRCGDWAPTPLAYRLGRAVNPFTCLCGATSTAAPDPEGT